MRIVQIIFLLSFFFLHFIINAQGIDNRKRVKVYDSYIDTLIAQSRNYDVSHWYSWTDEIECESMNSPNSSAEIFDNSLNTFSRLQIISGERDTINLPSIPLKYIIIDEKKGIIVGLSDFISSPYNIVLYSLDGKLLFKKKLNLIELRFNTDELKNFKKIFPIEYEYLIKNKCIYTEGGYIYAGLGFPCNCIYNYDERFRIYCNNKWFIKGNHYFNNMATTTGIPQYGFKSYVGLFSQTDPLYDILMLGAVPVLLILNAEDGEKVNIPIFP